MSFHEIMDLLDSNRYSRRCRDNLLKCISLTDCENFKFMDIETKGLSNVPVILIGVAEIKGNKINVPQTAARFQNHSSRIKRSTPDSWNSFI